jgi:hypothetical protein
MSGSLIELHQLLYIAIVIRKYKIINNCFKYKKPQLHRKITFCQKYELHQKIQKGRIQEIASMKIG